MNTPDEAPNNTGKVLRSQKVRVGDDGELNTDIPVNADAARQSLSLDDLFDSNDSESTESIPTDTASMLRRAAKLIKDQDNVGAMKIVQGVLAATQQNADAWYLYAYLSADRTQQINALNRALAINPNHERARQLMATVRLGSSGQDVFEGILPEPSPQAAPVYYQPLQKKTDDTAFIIGFLCAAFMGFFGVAHLMKGKLAAALGYFIIGLIWMAFGGIMTAITGLCAAPFLLALHFYFAWVVSKQGATLEPSPHYIV